MAEAPPDSPGRACLESAGEARGESRFSSYEVTQGADSVFQLDIQPGLAAAERS